MTDAAKLAALRAKYGDGKGSEVSDPVFQKAVSVLFSGGDKRRLP